MPELPELEAFKKYVSLHALKKNISDVQASDKKLIVGIPFTAFKKALIGHQLLSATRMGKYLVISVSGTSSKVIMHFALTGFLVYTKAPEKVPFCKVEFIFKDNSVLHWCSIRKFERIWFNVPEKMKILQHLGPDPLRLSKNKFEDLLDAYKQKNVKSFLMDQTIIAGIGNEYSDEILFQAKIDPHHKVQDLSKAQRNKLYKKMHEVLNYAISLRTKRSNLGQRYFERSSSQKFKSSYLLAHRHTDMLCPNHKTQKLKKVTIGGRSAYYCPKDQK